MYKLALEEASLMLADLIDKVDKGEEVIIIRQDGSAFRIVPTSAKSAKRGLLGIAEGKIRMADDFDEPLEDFEVYSH